MTIKCYKMAALRSGIKDKLSKTPPLSSSARDNQKQLGTDISRRKSKMGIPFKVRGNRSEKERFLAAEEAVKLKSDTKAVSRATHGNLSFPTNSPDPLSSIHNSTKVPNKIGTSLLTETTNALADEKHSPGFPSKKSAIESVTIAKALGDRLCERVALKEPRGKEVGLISRRGSVKEIQADAAILPEKVEASIMSENSNL
ncbi:hypothetical protein Acr_22g0003010 [Actinidia rufa]|uniref:Uncharacterized protein n=1 Tax=Actinidia rufa TaxID=165716 RepID=A0A7J0GJB1_9ERIC|nr:hypothetical protein Acr_22g0003010 [Actinidia rufa]